MIGTILDWFTSAASWSGSDGIPHRLWQHVLYSLIILAVASAIAIPLGLWVGHSGRGSWLVAVANSARAIPSLGLLLAITLWLGPHLKGSLAFTLPSIIVLVLLAIPPILAGAYSGVTEVDPAARDAAKGVGMSGGEVLRQVELPCALPLLISGVRAATLQVIATTTIAAYVGVGGLGRYLIDGLASGQYAVMAGGSILVAVLAVLADALLAFLQRTLVSPGLTGKQTGPTRVANDSAARQPSTT